MPESPPNNMQANYRSLLDKKLNARIAENLEKRQKGEQFRILDPANLPRTPEKPNRRRIMLVGLVLGCGLGFGIAFMTEQLNLTYRSAEDVESVLGLHVLAAIPDFTLAYAHPRRRKGLAPLRVMARAGAPLIESDSARQTQSAGRLSSRWPFNGKGRNSTSPDSIVGPFFALADGLGADLAEFAHQQLCMLVSV